MTIDQVKVIEIGADAIETALQAQPYLAAYPPKLMHVVVAALGRHGFIIEDRYEEDMTESVNPTTAPVDLTPRTAPDWETSGDDA